MKKVINGLINNLRYFCLLAAITLGLMAIVATGGGGGGGGGGGTPPMQYTGLSTPATIDGTNAVQLAVGAYAGGAVGSVMGSGAVAQTGKIGRPRTLTISKALEKAIRHIDVASALGSASFGAIITDSGTIDGNCGGSLSYTINIDDVTGDFTGNFNFNNYCEDGVTFSGNSSVSGTADLVTEEFIQLSLSFDSLSITTDGDSITIDGSITYDDLQAPLVNVDMDFLMRDDSTKKVYWLHNYYLRISEGPDYIDFYILGRYYDPDYGYVDSESTTDFRIYDGDVWPSQGVLIIEGETGIAGGSTMARLTAGPPGIYEVDADTNGDGAWDWNSGPLNW